MDAELSLVMESELTELSSVQQDYKTPPDVEMDKNVDITSVFIDIP